MLAISILAQAYPPFSLSTYSSLFTSTINIPNELRPKYLREIERASRHRTQDAFEDLRNILDSIPRENLQQLLSIADPTSTLRRRGLTRAQAIRIAITMIRYVLFRPML